MELIRTVGRRRFGPEEREQLLVAYRRSGLTQREFASQHGVSLSSLVLWLRKHRQMTRASTRPPFIALPTGLAALSSPQRTYAVDLGGGQRLEIARGFDREEVEQLCRILRQP